MSDTKHHVDPPQLPHASSPCRAASFCRALRKLGPAVALALTSLPVHADPLPPALPQIHDGESGPAKAWGQAVEAGDLAALARMHDAATTSYPPDATQEKGGAAIMKGYAQLFAKYIVKVSSQDAHWIEQGPLVVSWGLTTMTLHPKSGGADTVSNTRFTDAAVKTKDGWTYVIDHASMPAAK